MSNFKQKIQFTICAIAVVAICLPLIASAQRPSGAQRGQVVRYNSSVNSGRSQSPTIYKWGPATTRSPSYNRSRSSGYRNYYAPNKSYRPGYSGYANNNYGKNNYGYKRSYNSLAVSPYGLRYGNYGYGGSVRVAIPFYRTYAPVYQTYGANAASNYGSYAQPYSTSPSYSTPAYGVSGYYATPSNDATSQTYIAQPEYAQPEYNSLATTGAEALPSTRSALKPTTIDYDRQQFSSNKLNVIPTAEPAEPTQRRAEQAFRMGQYADAARLANEALVIDPNNGKLMLFAAQANFAAGYYDQAANEVDTATDRLPTDQWDYVVKNFRQFYGRDDYINQTNQLATHISNNPTDNRALILRGYQYGALGFPDAAAKDFQAALQVDPNNSLATKLLSVMGATEAPIRIQTPVVRQPQPPQTQASAKQAAPTEPRSPDKTPVEPTPKDGQPADSPFETPESILERLSPSDDEPNNSSSGG